MRRILDDAGFEQVEIAGEVIGIAGSTPEKEAAFAPYAANEPMLFPASIFMVIAHRPR